MTKIIQIIPANGWVAKFDVPQNGLRPLACWALHEEGNGETIIKGMIPATYGRITSCDEFDEFLYYVHESSINQTDSTSTGEQNELTVKNHSGRHQKAKKINKKG